MESTSQKRLSKLFVLYFISILIVLAVSVCSFMLLFERTSQRQLLSYGQTALDSNVLFVDSITSTIKEIFDSISFDGQISKLLNYDNVQSDDLYLSLQRLKSYTESNSYIDSIYIFNRAGNELYVSSPNAQEAVYSPSEFYDQQAVDLMMQYSSYRNMQPIFRHEDVSYPNEARIQLVSFLRYNTLKKANMSDVIMINIKQDIFSRLIGKDSQMSNRMLLFTDGSGWFAKVGNSSSVYDDNAIAGILEKLEGTRGAFCVSIGGRDCIVCHQSVMNGMMSLVLVADESNISTITRTEGYGYSILLLAVLFAICILATISVVKAIIHINASHREAMASLEREKRDIELESRMAKMLALLHSNPAKNVDQGSICDLFGPVDLSAGVVLVAFVIGPDCSKESKQEVCFIAEHELKGFNPLCSAYESSDCCYILLQCNESEPDLEASLRRCLRSIEDQCNSCPIAFVSQSTGFPKIPEAYSQLSKALPCRMFYKPSSIITSQMMQAREAASVQIPETLSSQFYEHLLQASTEEALLELRQLLDVISRGSYKAFQACLIQLAFTMDEALGKLQTNNGISRTAYIDALIYNMPLFKSIEAVYKAFETMIIQVEQNVMENKSSHHSSLVRKMQDIMRSSYCQKDFSIISVSEKIGMNASYLGKLFKRTTGMSFTEFLHKVRLEAACNLLETSDMKIADIADAVGYSDVPYFYKIFRKAYGCTPVKYMKEHR
jgi:two-component system response regulator YesN